VGQAVAHHHEFRHGPHLRHKSLDERQKGLVEQQHIRFRLVQDEYDLLVEQAWIDGFNTAPMPGTA
jgi:hypothetical protein